ncbi:MAG TPA: VWA domain-containing protein [Deferrisomatales bacterium]|nr:VWA domain-containing protein [Deferrisomatales bacterium]
MKPMYGIPSSVTAALAAAICLVGLSGCGVDESTSSPANPGPGAPLTTDDDRLSNPTDGGVTEFGLETSFGYDPAADRGLAYFALRDQDGASIWDFKTPEGTPGYGLNGRNFGITLFPSVAPRILDPAAFQVGVSSVLTNKVIALVIDVSGSMADDAGGGEGTRMEVAKEVAAAFVDVILDQANDPDLIALVSFSTEASILSPLTNDATKLKELIDTLEPTDATNFSAGFTEAVKAVGIQPGKRAVVFLTDGVDTIDGQDETFGGVAGLWPAWNEKPRSLRWQAMERLVDYQLVTYTIGFGDFSGGDEADLRAFANDSAPTSSPPSGLPAGAFFAATTVDALNAAFDPSDPTSIPSRIESEVAGVSSPFVSFPNDYPGQAGPISVRVTVSFENLTGKLSATSAGTFIVP